MKKHTQFRERESVRDKCTEWVKNSEFYKVLYSESIRKFKEHEISDQQKC